jgi:hypothetical protein
LDGIILTDHHRTVTKEGAEVLTALRQAGLVAFAGCEFSTRQGHCLVYGVDVGQLGVGRYPLMQDLITAVRAAGGVACPSHPYREAGKYRLGNYVYHLRGLLHLECMNGQNQTGWDPAADEVASAVAEQLQLHRLGGSDAHRPEDLGLVWTEFPDSAASTKGFLDALKAGDCSVSRDEERIAQRRSTNPYSPWFGTLSFGQEKEDYLELRRRSSPH